MTKHLTALLLVLTLSLCGTAALSESSAPAKKAEALPTIKYEKYKLKNGLEVILSEDHRLPLVAVDLWYHVGPANERTGRTGFAHLFEHMMFEGSKHVAARRTSATSKGGRHGHQRHHQLRSHQLLRDGSLEPARARALARERSHGLPARHA